MKKKRILISLVIFLLILAAYIKGCAYLPIEGTVVDAEMGKPIEGAVVLAEWTVRTGIGLTSTISYKVVETVSDRDGKFEINAYIFRPYAKPHLTIYKAGYVCWNNEFIFPSYQHRDGFLWRSDQKYSLERFKKEYTFIEHTRFIDSFAGLLNINSKTRGAYRWEELMRQKELAGEK